MFPVGPWLTSLGVMRCIGIAGAAAGTVQYRRHSVKDATHLPKDLVADEKTSWLAGERVYIATTAGQDCLLGASVSPSAAQGDLTEAYGRFAQEARDVDPTYEPSSVNTDGWQATQGAWKALFSNITVILCFLHAFLKVRAGNQSHGGSLQAGRRKNLAGL